MRLYVQYERPHLEFNTPAWAPWTEGDEHAFEKVQKKAISMMSGLAGNVYEESLERLKELGLQTLEERHYQADMGMMHKIMHVMGSIEHGAWFAKVCDSERVTRVATDNLNVKVKNCRLDIRKNFFSVQASSKWNSVPTDIKRTMPAHLFKKAYRRHREDLLPDA